MTALPYSCGGLWKKTSLLILLLASLLAGCSQQEEPLVIYAGKGLKLAVDELAAQFEKREKAKVSVIYAGSKTLLNTIRNTHKGDIFIPGSQSFITKAGSLITRHELVGIHTPTFAISPQNKHKLQQFKDIALPGVKVAVGNNKMNAIGIVTEAIIEETSVEENFRDNIIITAATVNELIQLVAEGQVDAALIWKDMLRWKGAKGLTEVTIPKAINKLKEIHVSTLSTTTNQMLASRFFDYASSKEGVSIFEKHGFTQ